MKILIISDIHGDYKSLYNILKNEKHDELIILGDLMNYGYHKDERILELLLKNKDKLILIKGNCDRYINLESYGLYGNDIITLTIKNHRVTLTHGDIYNKLNMPNFYGDIFINGHSHIPSITKSNNVLFLNPGSISYPRYNSPKTYMIMNEEKVIIKSLNGTIVQEKVL